MIQVTQITQNTPKIRSLRTHHFDDVGAYGQTRHGSDHDDDPGPRTGSGYFEPKLEPGILVAFPTVQNRENDVLRVEQSEPVPTCCGTLTVINREFRPGSRAGH